MGLNRALKLLIGVRLNNSSVESLCTWTEKLLNEITTLETDLKKVPIHWNFGLSPLLDALEPGKTRMSKSRGLNDLILEIKTRMKTRGDMPIPTGFRSAVHSLLSPKELEKELDWCSENPWMPGFKNLFGQESEIIMPVYPDILRELSQGVYSKRGFKYLGLPMDPTMSMSDLWKRAARLNTKCKYRFQLSYNMQRAVMFSYILFPFPDHSRYLKMIFKRLNNRGKVIFILFEIKTLKEFYQKGNDSGLLKPILETLSARFAFNLCSLSDSSIFTDPSPYRDPGAGLRKEGISPQVQGWAAAYNRIQTDPLFRRQCILAEPMRAKKNKKASDFRSILNSLSPELSDEHLSDTCPLYKRPRAKNRIFIANMTGSVVLTEKNFEARFFDGRFSGISVQGKQLLSGKPSRAYLTISGKRYFFRTESAFSFQGKQEAGLHAVLVIEIPETDGRTHKPGKLIIDYYFIEGIPELILDVSLNYPSLNSGIQLEEVVPLEIPLFILRDTEQAFIQAVFPGGSHYSSTLSSETPLKILYGSQFIISKGEKSVTLRFNNTKIPRIGFLQFSISRMRRSAPGCLRSLRNRQEYILSVNLNGSYLPADPRSYSELLENFSFKIGLTP